MAGWFRALDDRDEVFGPATRETLERALAVDLRRASWRVLAGVLYETATWSRTWDGLRLARLVELTGLGERTVQRALRQLDDFGVLTFESGGFDRLAGRNVVSRVALRGVALPAISNFNRPIVSPVPEGGHSGHPGDGHSGHPGGGHSGHPSLEGLPRRQVQQQADAAAAEVRETIRRSLGIAS